MPQKIYCRQDDTIDDCNLDSTNSVEIEIGTLGATLEQRVQRVI